ncbi:hypothetical protein NFI96_008660 [Prochilodus magdalenae]|nr:hypothetical protein NFI96_008660 [Prochilodus magdalenae]
MLRVLNIDHQSVSGQNLLRAHKVREQINGGHNDSFAQKLDLGWVIIGEVCLGNAHKPIEVSALKTHVLKNGRPSYLTPCDSHFSVKEDFSLSLAKAISNPLPSAHPQLKATAENLGDTVFCRTNKDNQLAHSVEDMIFLKKMEGFFKDNTNNWVAPLPFRSPRRKLPDNRSYTYQRHTLDKKPEMKAHFVEFGRNIPIFGVYHPQKPGKIHVVFDSSTQFDGVSLNDVLLSGPDLNNTLLGVLLRFGKEPVAITADIEQMFYCFVVQEDHRDYLRFLWYKDNDLTNDVADYRMRVHVFGNSPSPAVAIYGLRMAAREAESEYGTDA